MKVLDALLMKLGEELTELSSASSITGQLTSKAVRFGLDSHHPDDASQTTNEQLILGGISDLLSEVVDVLLFHWLVGFYCTRGAKNLPTPALLISTPEVLSQSVMKLDHYMRYSDIMVKIGSMSSAEHAELVTCVTDAKAHLMGKMTGPFVL